jgi:hypothetical protein
VGTRQELQKAAIQGVITTAMYAVGQGGTFKRVISEVQRANEQMPNATGQDKRNKVVADLKIIFADFVVPLATYFIHFLIEAALVYLYGRVTEASKG